MSDDRKPLEIWARSIGTDPRLVAQQQFPIPRGAKRLAEVNLQHPHTSGWIIELPNGTLAVWSAEGKLIRKRPDDLKEALSLMRGYEAKQDSLEALDAPNQLLIDAIELLFGDRGKTALADKFEINRLTVSRWISGHTPLPAWARAELIKLCRDRATTLIGIADQLDAGGVAPAGKKLPTFTNDAEVEAFVADADLTEYDLSEMQPVRFEREEPGDDTE